MTVRVILPLILLALALCGCKEAPPPVATTAPAAAVLELDLKPLTPLLPSRPTHIAVDPQGIIYWVQESDFADDTMFVIGKDDVPGSTQLSAANISAALGGERGRGNIHGIACGPEGVVYFYFSGAIGRRTLACIGQYWPKTSRIRVLADTDRVAAVTGMGRSLPLARGSVVSDGRNVWIWLRHTDISAVFRLDAPKLPPDGAVTLGKAFESAQLDNKPLNLMRERAQISAAPDGCIFLLDIDEARVLKIDSLGNATVVRSLIGLPNILSTPTVDRNGRFMIFAANAPIIGAKAGDPGPAIGEASFPSLLLFEGDKMTSIERDFIHAYPGFAVFGMRLRQLEPQPGEEAWISYDAGSGELMRAKLRERLWR